MNKRQPSHPIKLYSMRLSGHGHRVVLLLSMLRIPYKRIDLEPETGALHQPAFLALNPLGQVPVIVDGPTVVCDSNAILVYLARRYGGQALLPDDPEGAAAVQRWFSLVAGEVTFGPCAARRLRVYSERLVDMETAQSIATRLFDVIEGELATRLFAIGSQPSLADLAAYAYIARSDEGGLSLDEYPNIRAWLGRIEALPGFVPMPHAEARVPG
jgi:glutathione S-transferase